MKIFTILKFIFDFLLKKIDTFFLNFKQIHAIYLFLFLGLYFLKQYIIPVGDYNNACYE